jgi:hypothetical protein
MFTEDEVRIMGLAAPQMLKLLESREAQTLNKIYGEFRNNKLDQTAALAEFTCLRSLINDIKNVLNQHQKQETKRHAEPTTKR